MHPAATFHPAAPKRVASRGFTLVELLVVILVVGLVIAAVAPMVFSTLSSTRLTTAGESLAAQISLARQMAVSRNEAVEVRFYQYSDSNQPGSKDEYRAMSIMRVQAPRTAAAAANDTSVLEALTPVFYLPSGTIIGEASTMSPILVGNVLKVQTDRERLIKRSDRARYKAFRFSATGSPNLETLMGGYDPSKSYITLIEEKPSGSNQQIPKNFFTLQIDPATGKTSAYRP